MPCYANIVVGLQHIGQGLSGGGCKERSIAAMCSCVPLFSCEGLSTYLQDGSTCSSNHSRHGFSVSRYRQPGIQEEHKA